MARQNDRNRFRSSGNLALKPEVESNPEESIAPKYEKRGNLISPNFNRKIGAEEYGNQADTNRGVLSPDYKQTGIAKDIENSSNIRNFPTPNTMSINNLRQNENAPTQNPLNYTGGDNKKDAKDKANPIKPGGKKGIGGKLGGFFAKHKAATVGGAITALIATMFTMLTTSMIGPATVIHTAEYVGDIADTVHDIASLGRTIKSAVKGTKLGTKLSEFGAKISNTRFVSSAKQTITGFKKILSGADNLDDVVLFGKSLANNNSKLASMTKRISGQINKVKGFHPIKSLTGIIKSKAVGAGIKIKKMIIKFAEKHAKNIAMRVGKAVVGGFGKVASGIKSIVAKITEKVGKITGSKVFSAFTKVISAVKSVPGLGYIIGVAVQFVVGLIMRRMSYIGFDTQVNVAAGHSTDYQAMAGQIKYGYVPAETDMDEEGVDLETEEISKGDFMQEIGLFVESNIYSEDTVLKDNENSPCNYLNDEAPGEDAEPEDWDEFYEKIDVCMDNYRTQAENEGGTSDGFWNSLFSAIQNIFIRPAYADNGEGDIEIVENVTYSFWQAPMVQHELGNPTYADKSSYIEPQKHGLGDDPYASSVPRELIADNYSEDEGVVEDVLNSFIEAVAFVAPDTFEEEDALIDTSTANPTEKGNIATIGAKASSNTQMLAAGGYVHEEGSLGAKEIEATRVAYLQNQFNEKPLLAKLFDVEDYRSAIVTLARDSGWNTADPSFFTQLKNVAKTFAKIPSLIAKSINKASYANATNPPSDFYGIGTVGYTKDQLDSLPDFDVAADGVIKYHGEIKQNDLKYSGVKEIAENGRVIYNEDTDADYLDITAKKNYSLGDTTKPHGVTLCDDGSFVWADDDPTGEIAAGCFSEVTYDTVDTDDQGGKTEVLATGYAEYTTDQIVRTYLLDYPIIMAGAADNYKENLEDGELTPEEKIILSDTLDDAMQDMGVIPKSSSYSTNTTSETKDETMTTAEILIQMFNDGDIGMEAKWSCSGQGGIVSNEIKYIAENGVSRIYPDGNCSSTRATDVQLTDGLMQFILDAAKATKEENIKLTIYSLVSSYGAPGGTNNANGDAVDFTCPAGQEVKCQTILNEVGVQYGFSALLPSANYILDPNSTQTHFSLSGATTP